MKDAPFERFGFLVQDHGQGSEGKLRVNPINKHLRSGNLKVSI